MANALIVCRAVHFAAAMLVFGAAAFRIYGVSQGDPTVLPVFEAWLRRVLLGSAIAALLAALALVPCVAATMAASAAAAFDAHTLSATLFDTRFGHVWCWHLALAVLVVVGAAQRVPAGWQALLAALSLACLGLVGHAIDDRGPAGVVHEMNDVIHLLAGGLWLGGLVPLAALAIRSRHADDVSWFAMLRQALPRFSRVGYGVVALVALTGVINAIFLVGRIDALTGTPYGRLLLIKIALFLLLLAVAVINRLILSPWIAAGGRSPGAAAGLSSTIAIELLFGAAIIAVVGVLGTLPPAIHAHMH